MSGTVKTATIKNVLINRKCTSPIFKTKSLKHCLLIMASSLLISRSLEIMFTIQLDSAHESSVDYSVPLLLFSRRDSDHEPSVSSSQLDSAHKSSSAFKDYDTNQTWSKSCSNPPDRSSRWSPRRNAGTAYESVNCYTPHASVVVGSAAYCGAFPHYRAELSPTRVTKPRIPISNAKSLVRYSSALLKLAGQATVLCVDLIPSLGSSSDININESLQKNHFFRPKKIFFASKIFAKIEKYKAPKLQSECVLLFCGLSKSHFCVFELFTTNFDPEIASSVSTYTTQPGGSTCVMKHLLAVQDTVQRDTLDTTTNHAPRGHAHRCHAHKCHAHKNHAPRKLSKTFNKTKKHGNYPAPKGHTHKCHAPKCHAPKGHAPQKFSKTFEKTQKNGHKNHTHGCHAPNCHAPKGHAPQKFSKTFEKTRKNGDNHAHKNHTHGCHAPKGHAPKGHAPKGHAPQKFSKTFEKTQKNGDNHAHKGHSHGCHAPQTSSTRSDVITAHVEKLRLVVNDHIILIPNITALHSRAYTNMPSCANMLLQRYTATGNNSNWDLGAASTRWSDSESSTNSALAPAVTKIQQKTLLSTLKLQVKTKKPND